VSASFDDGRFVALKDRNLAVTVPINFEADDSNVPAIVRGTIDFDPPSGKLIVTRLEFVPRAGDPPLNDRRALRLVSIPSILDEATRISAVYYDPDTMTLDFHRDIETTPQDVSRIRRAHGIPGVDAPRAHLVKVAGVYRKGGSRGTQAVMNEFGASRSTASRWIRQAREHKLLGPALDKRAGERSKPKKGRKQ
jgi:hypothetical protein